MTEMGGNRRQLDSGNAVRCEAIAGKPCYSLLFGFASYHSTVEVCSHSQWLVVGVLCKCCALELGSPFTALLLLREQAHLVWGKYLLGPFQLFRHLGCTENISPFLIHFDSRWCCVSKCTCFSVPLKQAVFCAKKPYLQHYLFEDCWES